MRHPARPDLRRGDLLRAVPAAAGRQEPDPGLPRHGLPRQRAPTRSPRRSKTRSAISNGETTPDRLFTLETVSCLGCCSLAPVIMVDDSTHGNLNRDGGQEDAQAVPEGRDRGGAVMKILVGLGTCGIAAGAEETYAALAKTQAAGTVRASSSTRPAASACATASRWSRSGATTAAAVQYGNVSADKVDRLLAEHVVQGQVDRGLAGAGPTTGRQRARLLLARRTASCCATAATSTPSRSTTTSRPAATRRSRRSSSRTTPTR